MKHRIVTSKEIETCSKNIWSANHWIPVHKVEECDDELKAELKRFKETLKIRFRADIQHLKEEQENVYQNYINMLRRKR